MRGRAATQSNLSCDPFRPCCPHRLKVLSRTKPGPASAKARSHGSAGIQSRPHSNSNPRVVGGVARSLRRTGYSSRPRLPTNPLALSLCRGSEGGKLSSESKRRPTAFSGALRTCSHTPKGLSRSLRVGSPSQSNGVQRLQRRPRAFGPGRAALASRPSRPHTHTLGLPSRSPACTSGGAPHASPGQSGDECANGDPRRSGWPKYTARTIERGRPEARTREAAKGGLPRTHGRPTHRQSEAEVGPVIT